MPPTTSTRRRQCLLKILEEPPPRAIFLIVSHAPGNLLPTIRSRCIRLDLSPLETASVERVLGEIVGSRAMPSSPGRPPSCPAAPRSGAGIAERSCDRPFQPFRKLFAAGLPFNRKDALEIAAAVSGRGNEGDEGWDMFCWLLTDWLTAHARALALAGAEAPGFRRGP